MKCTECRIELIKLDRYEEIVDLDEDATEGQMADYGAAELSGDLGEWAGGIVEYRCRKCRGYFQIISDSLESFDPLIIGWHEKAKEGDYFARYVFEYLAF